MIRAIIQAPVLVPRFRGSRHGVSAERGGRVSWASGKEGREWVLRYFLGRRAYSGERVAVSIVTWFPDALNPSWSGACLQTSLRSGAVTPANQEG